MGGGICVSFPAFFWAEKPEVKPLCDTKDFERPAKYGSYGNLVTGSVFFGLGWGLIGVCPGPAVAGTIPYLTQGLPGLSFLAGFICMCAAWLATDKLFQIREARLQKDEVEELPGNDTSFASSEA